MFELNATLVIFVISFLVFMWALDQTMLKPVGKILEERGRLIESQVEAGRKARQDGQAVLDKYEQDLSEIRHQAQATINKAIEDANRDRDRELGKIQAAGRERLEKALSEITEERASLLDQLVAHELELVETITRKVLGDESVSVTVDERKLRQTLEEAY